MKLSNNVKTAFLAPAIGPADSYTVHVLVSDHSEATCMPDPAVLWMSHLVDAYSERSQAYSKSEAAAERLAGTHAAVVVAAHSSTTRQLLCLVGLMAALGVLVKTCEASRSTAPVLLAGAAALLLAADLASSRLVHEGGLIHVVRTHLAHPPATSSLPQPIRSTASLSATSPASIRANLAPSLPPGSPLPAQLPPSSPLPIAVLQSYVGPQPGNRTHASTPASDFLLSYALRLNGPETSMSLLSCDWAGMVETLVCSGTPAAPQTPGTYILQLWRFTRAAEPLHPQNPDADARLATPILTHNLHAVPPPTSTNTPNIAAPAVAPESRGGRWLRLDCDPSARTQPQVGLPAPLIAQLCNHNTYLQPSTPFSTLPSFDSFLAHFSAAQLGPPGPQLVWLDDGLLPLTAPTHPPFRFLPDLAPRMNSTWVHLTGDSTSLAELAAHFTTLSRLYPSTTLLCAPSNPPTTPTAAPSYPPFSPCSPSTPHWGPGGVGGVGDSDASQTHLWLVSISELNLHLSYSYRLTPAALLHLHAHLSPASSPARHRRILSFGHGGLFAKDLNESRTLNSTKQPSALTSHQDSLLRTHLHDLAQVLRHTAGPGRPLPAFDSILLQGPASPALDLQSGSMDAEATGLISRLLRRWAAAQDREFKVKFTDNFPMTLPRAWSWALSPGPDATYNDNRHFTGNLLWALALKQLNTYAVV